MTGRWHRRRRGDRYLEEADALADRIAIFDHGKLVTQGTPKELKHAIAGDAIAVRPKTGHPGECRGGR